MNFSDGFYTPYALCCIGSTPQRQRLRLGLSLHQNFVRLAEKPNASKQGYFEVVS